MADRGEQGTSTASVSEDSDPSLSMKSVLVCLGERKREVSLASGNKTKELKTLRAAVRGVYSDMLHGNETIIFQLKREEWGGEFTAS